VTTEITNPDIPRVDAVDGPATGMPFLILKSQASADPAAVPAAPVVKAEGDDPAEDLEAEDKEGGANIDGKSVDDADANAADPGSPAWEATDAAKARVIVDALAQARAGIQELSCREEAEGDDYENVWNLEDAEYAIDAALAVLAKFAVDEQVDADQGAMNAEADARALGLIKSLAERHIRKEATVETEATTTEVAKADETLVAVYSADGKLMGAVSPDDLTPLNTGVPADSEAATDGDAPTAGEGDATPVEEAAAAAPSAEAAPAPATQTPAAAAADDTVTKSLDELVAEAVAKALAAAVATAVEPLVKSNEELTERVEKMARSPRDGGPMLSGQRPNSVGPALRGHQDAEASEELRKQLEAETDPGARTLGVAALIKQGWQSGK
jgi:hypothetical protein